jgi:hypothetical protein
MPEDPRHPTFENFRVAAVECKETPTIKQLFSDVENVELDERDKSYSSDGPKYTSAPKYTPAPKVAASRHRTPGNI